MRARCLLWSPYVIGQTIIFCPVVSVFFFLVLSSFFPRLISAVRDWMSTILPHMVWPQCEFRMLCLKCATRCSLKIQDAKKSPFWHHCTTLSGCILAAVSGQKCHCENLHFKRSAVTQDHQKRCYSVEFCASENAKVGAVNLASTNQSPIY